MKNRKSIALTPKQHGLIQKALALHQSGKLAEAAEQYKKLLTVLPDNTLLLTNLGNIALQQGKLEDGVRLIAKSVQISADQPIALNNLGNALKALNRVDEAIASYDRAIAHKPDYAEAYSNRGAALKDINRLDEALVSIERAIALRPDYVAAHSNRGVALLALNRLDEALDSFDRAMALNPGYVMAYINRANVLKDLKRLDEAVAGYDRAIILNPGYAEAYSNRGAALKDLNRLDEAVASYDKAIALNPGFAAAYYNRGDALLALKRPEEAVASLNSAIALKPDYADAYYNLGNAFFALKQLDEALANYDKAIALNPGLAGVYSNQGIVLKQLNRLDEALASYERALNVDPSLAGVYSNRGVALKESNRLDEALASYDQAINIDSGYADAYSNRGIVRYELKRLDEALADYETAIALRPDYAEAYWNKALLKILTGEYAEGWRLYEWRWRRADNPARKFAQPLWLGEQPLAGKTLLIYSEQGLGDYLQFIRYAALAGQLGGRVVLGVPIALMSLVSTLRGDFTLVESWQVLPDFDYHCPLMSLPLAFNTVLETIPAQIPYLYADQAKRQSWRQRLGEQSGLRVGLVCSGSTTHKNDQNRSIALERFAGLLELPVEFHLLQKEIRAEDAAFMAGSGKIQNHQHALHDFSDTAALLAEMDLLISVDTSVAHLAGALGQKVWILLPYMPDYRWLLDRTDSPWYPTATLYRQAVIGDWEGVLARVADDLEKAVMMHGNLGHANQIGRAGLPGATAATLNEVAIKNIPAISTTPEPHELLQQALALHQAGKLAEAAAQYQKLLNDRPDNTLLLTNLGNIALQQGRLEDGVRLISRSVQISANQPVALNNLGNALKALNRVDEAIASYDKAIAQKPDYAEAYSNRGAALRDLNRLDEALASYQTAIALDPNSAVAYSNQGVILKQLNRLDEALASYERALDIDPSLVGVYSNRAVTLKDLNRLDEALASCDRAIAMNPDYANAYSNRGIVLYELKRLDEAIVSYDKAIALNPGYAEAYSNRGNAFLALKRLNEALASIERAIEIKPDYAEAYSSRGNAFLALNRLDDALASYDMAIALNPDYVDAYYNRGIALYELKRLDEALANYETTIALRPDYAKAYWNKALLKLLVGDYAEGWRLSEWCWRRTGTAAKTFASPLWLGEPSLAGKTLLIHPEQGLGDYLQFIRYAALVDQLGGRVVLEAPAPLMGIVASLEGDFTLIESWQVLPDFDYHCPLMSLPLAFNTVLETIPAQIPYLYADQAKRQSWRQRLGEQSGLRVGLVCSGSTTHKNDQNRSIALERFAGLLELPVEFHLLQKEIRAEDAAFMAGSGKIQNHQHALHDFSDTAALLAEMDLLISVDTSVAHLAGALGQKVWILLPYMPDYRWLLDRTDSPWYPTATLYRQAVIGDWEGVLARVADDLEKAVMMHGNLGHANQIGRAGLPGATAATLNEVAIKNIPAISTTPEPHELLQQALALHQAGKLAEAAAQYQKLLNDRPDNTLLLTNLGNIALQQGRLEDGVRLISRSVQISANQPVALNNLGNALKALNRVDEAIASYDKAIAQKPDYAEAYSNRGAALRDLNRLDEALASLDRAIELKPDYAAAHSNRGVALLALNRLDEALDSFDRAIAVNPGYAMAHINRGNALKDLKRLDDALAAYDRAIALKPNMAEAYSCRGAALIELKRLDEAFVCFNHALGLKPDYAETYYNRGNAFLALKSLEEALADYDRAIALRPDYAEAYWNKALLKILTGDYAEGWRLYEWRWRRAETQAKKFARPLWLGERSLAGKTLLIHPEQGLGDYLQFVRYAALAGQQAARVILEAPAPLMSLVSTLPGDFTLIESGQVLPDFDYQCPVMSLPLAFNTVLETIPAQIPYLYADQAKRQLWRQRLGEKSGLRVGLVCSGSTAHKNDQNRSIALERFAALLELPVEFHLLQKEIRAEDAAFMAGSGKIQNHQHALHDFSDTAALLAEMDLLISVDTSVAHLAGALGQKVWILLPYMPDYRWLLDRTDSPWYPTATVYRQSAIGDWDSVICVLGDHLGNVCGVSADAS
ncbi:MAG: tetratricopeptide repeat protein [Methylococcales bacterium]|nr:tetratricopeptide repeat protein [Methylococcales bacterium]